MLDSRASALSIRFPAVRSVLWVREALGAPYVLGWRPSLAKLRLEEDALDLLRAGAAAGGGVDLSCRLHASSLVLKGSHAASWDGYLLRVAGAGAAAPSHRPPPAPPLHLTLSLEGGEGEGALRLQALAEVPTLSLHVQPLALPPRLSPTPLARAGPLRTTPSPVPLCGCGLLTLDQTRAAVMLLADDPSARTTPCVGLWFRQGDTAPTVTAEAAGSRPAAGALPPWAAAAIACCTFRAACVWYERDAPMGERVRPPGAPHTLLVALLPPAGDAVEVACMVEVTAAWPARSAGAAAEPTSVPYGPHSSWGADGWLTLSTSLTLPAVGPPCASPGTARQSGSGIEWDLLPRHGGGEAARIRTAPALPVACAPPASAPAPVRAAAPSRIPTPRSQGGSPRRHPSEGTLSPWQQLEAGGRADEVQPEALPAAAEEPAPPPAVEGEGEGVEAARPPLSLAAMRAELEGLTSRLRAVGGVGRIHTFTSARAGRPAVPPPLPRLRSALPPYAGAPLPAFVTEVLARHAARTAPQATRLP